MTIGKRIKNSIIGAGLGLAAGGAIVATGGVAVGAVCGIGASIGSITALQSFAIGAPALDFASFALLPIFCIDIEPIEYETPSPVSLP